MRKVYICSPFRGEVEKNIEKAKVFSKWVYNKGILPITVHFYLEEATGLSEEKGDRNELINLGCEMLLMCDECWVFGNTITEGMKKELEIAYNQNIEVKYIKEEEVI